MDGGGVGQSHSVAAGRSAQGSEDGGSGTLKWGRGVRGAGGPGGSRKSGNREEDQGCMTPLSYIKISAKSPIGPACQY